MDARLRVADCFAGRLADSPSFVEYERPIIPWRMTLGKVDGETVVIILRAAMIILIKRGPIFVSFDRD